MNDLAMAIQLRREGQLVESNDILLELIGQNSDEAVLNYHVAWSFDLLGMESKAVPYYEKAIHNGLQDEDALGAFIGLGSTYRTIGEYEKSKNLFETGLERFPDNNVLQTFYAMTLYNVGQYEKAMEILLICLVKTTNDSGITSYKRAIEFYADKLDTIW